MKTGEAIVTFKTEKSVNYWLLHSSLIVLKENKLFGNFRHSHIHAHCYAQSSFHKNYDSIRAKIRWYNVDIISRGDMYCKGCCKWTVFTLLINNRNSQVHTQNLNTAPSMPTCTTDSLMSFMHIQHKMLITKHSP